MENPTTEEKILKAAQSEFAENGFDGARIDRIAKNAAVNKAMIYYHFKGKEALYEHILIDLYQNLFQRLTASVPIERKPDEKLFAIVETFISYISTVDENYIRIMLREISSGGRFFKKVLLPNLIIPILANIVEIIEQGKREGIFRDIHNTYTFLQVIGSVVFFNAIRITIQGTEAGKNIFSGDYLDTFKKNLISIIQKGILA